MSKKILIFAPHGSYQVHHQLDAVIGAALRQRGCEVIVVVCDQLFLDCYVAGRSNDSAVNCSSCFNAGVALYQAFQLPIVTLRSLLDDTDYRDSMAWAQGVDLELYQQANFEGLQIGQWTGYGLYAHFKSSRLKFSNPETEQVARNSLRNGAILSRAIKRLMQHYQPDHAITYQGGHSYYRVFYEMMRARNVPVLVHERGYTDDSFLLLGNRTNYEMNYLCNDEWCNWESAPLTSLELQQIDAVLEARERGQNMNFVKFSGWESSASTLRRTLRLPESVPLLVLFGSGDWEVGMYRGYGQLKLAHRSQFDWIMHSAELAKKLGMHMVVRHHPLGAGTATYTRADEFLSELIEFNRSMGDHVRVVMPYEKINSYELIWNADAAVSLFSTTSVEAVTRGVGSATTGHSVYQPAGVTLIQSPEEYESVIRQLTQRTSNSSIETLRGAYRYMHFIYFVAFSQRFRSVGIRNVYERDIRIQGLNELAPGIDPVLDRVCDHILYGAPLYTLPGQDRSQSEESVYLEQVRNRNCERRERARGNASACNQQETEILILSLAMDDNHTINPAFMISCARSRHRRARILTVSYRESFAAKDSLSGLSQLILANSAPFVWVVREDAAFDESFLSSACDTLVNDPNKDLVASGCYILNHQKALLSEFATELVNPFSLGEDNLRKLGLCDLSTLISCVVWRREFLVQWLDTILAQQLDENLALRGLFSLMFQNERCVPLKVPSVYHFMEHERYHI